MKSDWQEFKECGVFTSDYDLDENGGTCFDFENGWEKGGGVPSTEKQFGEKSIGVLNTHGPTSVYAPRGPPAFCYNNTQYL